LRFIWNFGQIILPSKAIFMNEILPVRQSTISSEYAGRQSALRAERPFRLMADIRIISQGGKWINDQEGIVFRPDRT
jgi:hypothetical protein